jgi:arginyl-tRNA synthetase
MTTVLHRAAEASLAAALRSLALDGLSARLSPCPDPSLGDASSGVAMQAARALRKPPTAIAADLADLMSSAPGVARSAFAVPGYLNLTFADEAVAEALSNQLHDPRCGLRACDAPERIVIDFGGPNVKPMHVGHLRSLVIGESLRRVLGAVGHEVVSDIHLGDWGLPAGMILSEIRRRSPAAPWFSGGGPYPDEPPFAATDLATLYPAASAACATDPDRMADARAVTASLQSGEPGLVALWGSVVAMAKRDIVATCDRVGARFDLLLGESDAQRDIPATVEAFRSAGLLRSDGTALLVDVARQDDRHEVPPLVLEKEDGSALYATTDLATILARRRDLAPARILYVVDGRQHLHFLRVFRAAEAAGIADGVALEHVAFGTVNGPDGKPFRTRSGNAAGLVDLLDMARDAARARLVDGERLAGASEADLDDSADAIGLAALRIADLGSNRAIGYVLDLDKATSFEGRTGPYLLYALVRMRHILDRATCAPGPVALGAPQERALAMACLGYGDAVARAAASRAPSELVQWAFDLAARFSRFYAACPVNAAADRATAESRLSLCLAAARALSGALDLLGCRVPTAM